MDSPDVTGGGKPTVALIAGPTASGKSALALALAERANGVIINADSAQVYRDLHLVSARPTAADEARAPHSLYGYRDGAAACSAADWAADARSAVERVAAAGQLPILCGGTGLYIRTLLDGIAPVPEIDPAIRADVRSLPTEAAYAALKKEDRQAAARLNAADATRIARALEVVRSTGQKLAHWQQQREGEIASKINLMPITLLPPREWLQGRCDARFETMMGDAGQAEVRTLLHRELDAELPVMRAIGVREIAGLITGGLSESEAYQQGCIATRQYAKRQYTWFSRQPPADWPRFTEPLDSGMEAAMAHFAPLTGA